MSKDLMESQFSALEAPDPLREPAVIVDANGALADVTLSAIDRIIKAFPSLFSDDQKGTCECGSEWQVCAKTQFWQSSLCSQAAAAWAN
jgi:hypothetical protein